MTKKEREFEESIALAYDRLPAWVREKVKNVALIAEERVSEDVIEEMGLETDMDLLGFYHGLPLIERSNSAGFSLPDAIYLYRLPIEEEAKESGKSVADVLYETLWHEIAHHFGLDEDEVEEREREEFGV